MDIDEGTSRAWFPFLMFVIAMVFISIAIISAATAQAELTTNNKDVPGECTQNPEAESYIEITEFTPERYFDDPSEPDIFGVWQGEKMVVRGTTTQEPEDFRVAVGGAPLPYEWTVEADALADEIGIQVTDEPDEDGYWTAKFDVGEHQLEPGGFWMQAYDGERLDRVEAHVLDESAPLDRLGSRGEWLETPEQRKSHLEDEVNELKNQVRELRKEKENLEEEINYLRQEIQELEESSSWVLIGRVSAETGDSEDIRENSTKDNWYSAAFEVGTPYLEVERAMPEHIEDEVATRHMGLLEVNETMVLLGETTREPGDAVIEVKAIEGCQAAELPTASVEDWHEDSGIWRTEIEIPTDIAPGNYTLQVYDGERTDRLEVEIAPKGETPDRTKTRVDEIILSIDELEDRYEDLDNERDDLEEEVETLSGVRDDLEDYRDRLEQEEEEEGLPGFTGVSFLIAISLATVLLARRSRSEPRRSRISAGRSDTD